MCQLGYDWGFHPNPDMNLKILELPLLIASQSGRIKKNDSLNDVIQQVILV